MAINLRRFLRSYIARRTRNRRPLSPRLLCFERLNRRQLLAGDVGLDGGGDLDESDPGTDITQAQDDDQATVQMPEDEELADEEQDDEAGDEEPCDDEPGDEEPGDEEPGDEELDDEELNDEELNDEELNDDEPDDDEPDDDEPDDDEPDDEEPGDDEPGDDEPDDEEPGDEEPSDDEPGDNGGSDDDDDSGGGGDSGDDEPGDEEPSDEQPGDDGGSGDGGSGDSGSGGGGSGNDAGWVDPDPDATILYVDPLGDDGNAGTLDQPLKTFAGARDKVRSLIDGSKDIVVYFREGTYAFEQTVVLGPEDSGTVGEQIYYAAYPGETPVFTSLKPITGFTHHDGNIMVADLPSGIDQVRYLQDASESWLKRSSTAFFRPDFVSPYGGPESEHWEPDAQQRKTYTTYPASFSMPDPSKADQYDLRVHMTAWQSQVLPVSGIDVSTRRIDVATPSHYSLVNGLDDIQTEVWLLNSLEGIDQPGEWACLDGKIYLYPASGVDDIQVPTLEELIRVDGGGDGNNWTGTPVQYIYFDGFTFTGTDYRVSEASDVMAQHDWQMVDVPEGLVRFRNAANSAVRNSVFTKSGSDAVRMDRYAQNIVVDNCEFSYLGKGGVVMSGRGPGYGDVNNHNFVLNSHFNQTSRIKWDAAAVHLDQSSSNLIKQNYFEDIPLSAIIASGNRESNIAEAAFDPINRDFHFAEIRPDLIENWEGSSIHFYDHDNIVEENTFRAVHIGTPELIPAVSSEAPGFTNGMLYTTGRQAGGTNTFRKNYFYDVDARPTYSQTWVILGDGHEDYLDFHQNMAYNLQQIDGFEDPPFMSINANVSGRATANVKLNSPYSAMECPSCENVSYAGNIDFDSGTPGGSASYLAEYQEMWTLLCPGNLPGPSSLPGADALQAALASKIIEFGGTVPACEVGGASTGNDEEESGDEEPDYEGPEYEEPGGEGSGDEQRENEDPGDEESQPGGGSATTPSAGTDSDWIERFNELNARVAQNQGNVDLIWVGDSITHGWEDPDLPGAQAVWDQYYGSRRALNLGIGGDQTQQVLYRLQNGNLDGISPRVAIVQIGVNNLDVNTPQEVADGVTAVVNELRTRVPNIKIISTSVWPADPDPNGVLRAASATVNNLLASLHDGANVIIHDTSSVFLNPDGTTNLNLAPDSLHPNTAGYTAWAAALEPHVAAILGGIDASGSVGTGTAGSTSAGSPGAGNDGQAPSDSENAPLTINLPATRRWVNVRLRDGNAVLRSGGQVLSSTPLGSAKEILIQGTDAAEKVRLNLSGADAAALSRVAVDLGGGNDRIVVRAVDTAFAGLLELSGGGGHDILRATSMATSVWLDGGAGNDRLFGGRGHDTLSGGRGRDRLVGAAGNDVLDGGAGNDRLIAGKGDDTLTGGFGHDLLRGGAGNDTLLEIIAADVVLSNRRMTGIGNDRIRGIRSAIFEAEDEATVDTRKFSGAVQRIVNDDEPDEGAETGVEEEEMIVHREY